MSPSRSRRATVDFACLRVASLGYSFLIMVVIGFEFRDLFFPVVFKFSPVFLFYFLSGYVALRGKTSHGLACFIAGQSLKQSRSNEAVPISVRRWTHCWRSIYSFCAQPRHSSFIANLVIPGPHLLPSKFAHFCRDACPLHLRVHAFRPSRGEPAVNALVSFRFFSEGIARGMVGCVFLFQGRPPPLPRPPLGSLLGDPAEREKQLLSGRHVMSDS